jgi:hypothetical protein
VLFELGDAEGAAAASRALAACCAERPEAAALLERYRAATRGG